MLAYNSNIFFEQIFFDFSEKTKMSEMVKKRCYYIDFMILKLILRLVFLNFE